MNYLNMETKSAALSSFEVNLTLAPVGTMLNHIIIQFVLLFDPVAFVSQIIEKIDLTEIS
jgi:hypothetical protein